MKKEKKLMLMKYNYKIQTILLIVNGLIIDILLTKNNYKMKKNQEMLLMKVNELMIMKYNVQKHYCEMNEVKKGM